MMNPKMNSYNKKNNNDDLKINKIKQLNKLKNQSSSEDCSVESDILSNEFSNKVCLNDGNSDDDAIHYSREMFHYNEEQSKSVKMSIKPPNYITQQNKLKFADECEYRMNNKYRGIAVIINNKKFHSSLDMPVRTGTDKDAVSLQKTFHKIGFNVLLEHNKTAYDMRDMLNKIARSDHSENDCFVCCILSHGEEGIIYGTDQSVEIEHLIAPFKLNRTLAGKPKLFFIQVFIPCNLNNV